MKNVKNTYETPKKLILFCLSILSLLFTLSLLTGVVSNPFTKGAEAVGEIEIYSIEDLNAVRNDLTASYVLMNDLDFENPASWENHATNYDIIMNALPAGTVIEDEDVGNSSDGTSYTVIYPPIDSAGSVTVKVADTVRAPYEAGVTGGWQVTNYTTGEISFFDTAGNLITPRNLYGLSGWYDDVLVTYQLETKVYQGWEPIGTDNSSPFEGLFDGKGNTISNLSINRPTTNYIGLFGYNWGIIKNSVITNADVIGDLRVGALVGSNSNNGVVSTSSSSGSIVGNISETYTYVGGLVGQNYGNGTIINSYSTASTTGKGYVGGLTGHTYTGSEIINCYSTGVVTASGSYNGGLVGRVVSATVTNSFWDTETSGMLTSAGGTGKTTNEMKTLTTYQGLWNIVDTADPNPYIWQIDNGIDYPKLVDTMEPSSYLTQAGGYYIISTTDDLDIVKEYSPIPGLKFQLSSNLDLTSKSNFYIPYLAGELDGNGYEISNLSINMSGSDYLGLVGQGGYASGINNLGVVNVNITGNTYVGGIVGKNLGYVNNSYVTGTISGASYVGGITGYSHKEITGASVNASVTSSSTSYAGGITGYNRVGVSNSSFKGSLTGASSSYNPLVGYNYYNVSTGSADVTNSFYNYDSTTIDGVPLFTFYSLDQQVYEDWIANNHTFDLSLYFTQEGEYYLIDSISDLQSLRSFGWDDSLKFKLVIDLDLTSAPGLYIPYLRGEFDGNGHEISNLFLNMPDQDGVGLFGSIQSSGIVKNISVTNVDITGNRKVGAIAGSAGAITNSYATGSVTATEVTYSEVGGLSGTGGYSITNSAFIGSVNGPGSRVGFLSGYNTSSSGLENCFYNYDLSNINGVQVFTIEALETTIFNDWKTNGYTFDLTTYFPQEGGYYLIDSVEDIQVLKNFGWDKNLKIKLANDIDLIGNTNLYLPFFSGELNGNGNTISNLTINLGTTGKIGFIGELLEGATVISLGLINVDITGNSNVGGLVGYNSGIINYSYSSGTVTGTNGEIGGLVGYNDRSIYNSYTTGSVSSGANNAGSLLGLNTENGEVKYSYSNADVNATGSGVGALVGINNGLVQYSYSTGNATGNWHVGGLVGHNQSGTIKDTYSEGNISGDRYLGGLVGYGYSGSVIDNSYSLGTVTGNLSYIGGLTFGVGTTTNSFWNTETSGVATSSGGAGRTTAQLHSLATYTDTSSPDLDTSWNILPSTETDASIWSITDGSSYPELRVIMQSPTDYFSQEGDYYLLQNSNDLKWVAYSFYSLPTFKYKLSSNIDLTDSPNFYIPSFSGELDGNGYEISNLNLTLGTSDERVGFIGSLLPGGVIKNLGVTNLYINGGYDLIGGLVGFNEEGTITNCYTTGVIEGTADNVGGVLGYTDKSIITDISSTISINGDDYVGGIIGTSWGGEISNSSWAGSAEGNYMVGGLIGINNGSEITNCHTSGTVTGANASYVGGLVGYNSHRWTHEETGAIVDSYSTATVVGDDNVGGLVGILEGELTSITNSYATGDVTGDSSTIGGLAGSTNQEVTITNSFSTGNVTGDDMVGGFIGYHHSGTITNSYSTGNVIENQNYRDGLGIGGFIGDNRGEIVNSYSSGLVDGGTDDDVGGFIGENTGTTSNSFWDINTSGMSTSAGGTGKTTAQMKTLSTFNNTSTEGLDAPWDIVAIADYNTTNPNTWYINETVDYARLFFESPDYVPGTDPGDEPTDPPPAEEDVDPEISTSTPTNIQTTSATLNGVLSNLGTYDTVYVYFRYRASGAGVWVESSQVAKALTGSYSFSLIGLNANSTYEYTASANFGESGNVLGEIRTFSTATLVVEEEEAEEPTETTPPTETEENEEISPPSEEDTPAEEEEEISDEIPTTVDDDNEEQPITELEEKESEEKESVFNKVSKSVREFTKKAVKTISDINVDKKTADTVGTVGYAAATTSYVVLNFVTFTGNNSISSLQILSTFFMIGGLRKKKRQKYGIVYDSVTKEPINMATVRVFNLSGNLISTAVTDIYGVFDLELDDGQYKFEVVSRNHQFPSRAVLGTNDEPYQNIYKGGLINYNSNQALNISIPMDKVDRGFIAKALVSGKSMALTILNLLFNLLFVAGFLFTIISLTKEPTTITWIILALYLLSILIYIYISGKEKKSYGRVKTINGTPIEGLRIGLRELEFDTLYAKRVTDENGKYRFIIPEGKYRLECIDDRYVFIGLKKNTFEVSEAKLYILKEDITVKRIN